MKTMTMKKIAIALALSATLSGCANWGGYAGAGAGGGLGYLAANAANASPATRGLVTAAGAILGSQIGEKMVFKANLKPLTPVVAKNMTTLQGETKDAFERATAACAAADSAEMLYKTSPDDTQAHDRLREAAKLEISKWNAYQKRRVQLEDAVNAAHQQGLDVETFHDAAAELQKKDVPLYQRIMARKTANPDLL